VAGVYRRRAATTLESATALGGGGRSPGGSG
jgi:hypothetical protein